MEPTGENDQKQRTLASTDDERPDEQDDTAPMREVDSFGLPAYQPLHEDSKSTTAPELRKDAKAADNLECVVPWEMRETEEDLTCNAFQFMGTVEFWERVEFAVRTALMAVLPISVVLYTTWDDGPWVSQTFLISGALLSTSSKDTVGLQVAYLGQYFRASVASVGVMCVATALEVYRFTAAWVCIYFVFLFLFAALMEPQSRIVALLLITVMCMSMVRNQSNNVILPLRICAEWALGIGFSTVAVLLPWPQLSRNRAEKSIHLMSRNVATAWRGLASTFWAPANLQRHVGLVRVRFLMKRAEENRVLAKRHLEGATYEWMTETPSQRRLRQLKYALLVDVARELNSMRRVVELVRDRPQVLESSVRARLFGERLNPVFEKIAGTADQLLHVIMQTSSRRDIVASHLFDQLYAQEQQLESQFTAARREYFYESQYNHVEDFVPFMTYYLFCTYQVSRTLLRFQDTLRQELHTTDTLTTLRQNIVAVWLRLVSPMQETYHLACNLVFRRNDDDVREVIEAAKIAASMVASIGFYFVMDAPTAFLSGPVVIAFVASSNPAEALYSSLPRLTGALFGVALGFFISSISSNNVSRVAGLITLVFVARLVSHVKNIGIAMGFAAFIAVSQLSVTPISGTASLGRMQQTTFAITIYVLVTLFVFPCRPSQLLREQRANIVCQMSQLFSSIMSVFIDVGTAYEAYSIAENATSLDNDAAAVGDATTTFPPECNGNATVSRSRQETASAPHSLLRNTSFSASYIEFPQSKFDTINAMFDTLEHHVRVAQRLMPFAADEPTMSFAVYQTRACEDAHAAIVTLLALLRTMMQSVKLLRQRRDPPSLDMTRMLQHMMPVARDAVVEMDAFCSMLAVLVGSSKVNLTPELIKRSHSLNMVCGELHNRKGKMLLRVIQNSRQAALDAARRQPAPDREASVSTTKVLPRVPTDAAEIGIHGDSSSVYAMDSGDHDTTYRDLVGAVSAAMQSSNRRAPKPVPHARPCEGDVSSLMEGRVTMPPSFQLPVTVNDAEGIHAMTFSVVLFSSELRKLLVAVEDLLQQ